MLVELFACRIIDSLSCKFGLETFKADALDTYYQAQECDGVVVELAPVCFERFAKAGKDKVIALLLRRQLLGRRAKGQSSVEHLAEILMNK